MELSTDAINDFNTLMKGITGTNQQKKAPVSIVDPQQKERQFNELQKKYEDRVIESYLKKTKKKPRPRQEKEICISFLQ